jgi:hypothetical protein
VSPVRCELGLYIPEDDILHSHRHENLKSYIPSLFSVTSNDVLLEGFYRALFPKTRSFLLLGPLHFIKPHNFTLKEPILQRNRELFVIFQKYMVRQGNVIISKLV